MKDEHRRYLRYLEDERNAALLYRALANNVDGGRREALLELADIEDKHSAHWEQLLREAGVPVPSAPTELDADNLALAKRAKGAGLADVLAELEATETAAQSMYDDEPGAPQWMADDERRHAVAFRSMLEEDKAAAKQRSSAHSEGRHRVDRSGSVRAAVFGVSDGLVSNTALVMGFAGASQGQATVLLAGLAGLLAGAFSMAAGEYVSVASQRDLFRREIELEARELRDTPEEEQRELELIYRAKGLDPDHAARVAEQIMSDPKTALDTLAREELGLDPNELGSPIKVALSSFISFAIGASVVVLPYLPFFNLSSIAALVTAVTLAVVAMVVVGGVVGRLSGRGMVFSAFRQLAWGVGAALVTFGVGRLVGVALD